MSASVMTVFFLGHILGPVFVIIMMGVAGLGLGFGYVPPFAMLPDAIEVESRKTGKRHEGAYYGIWTFGAKIGQALSAMILGGVLSLGGYIPDVQQSEKALFAIRVLLGPIPAFIMILTIVVIAIYPLDEAGYEKALKEIKQEQ